jgi:hypothetical protein
MAFGRRGLPRPDAIGKCDDIIAFHPHSWLSSSILSGQRIKDKPLNGERVILVDSPLALGMTKKKQGFKGVQPP